MSDGLDHTEQPWADVRETAVSAVFLAGDHVLKMKKPVRTPYLDYSSIQARSTACDDEIRLNCRLSPDVYLGVVRIGLTDSGPGEPVVVMRRLANADQLDNQLAEDAGTELREVARTIADFHERCEAIDVGDAWAREQSRWREECDQIDLLGDRVAPLRARRALRFLGERYLLGRRPLLDQRAAAGKYRDGHGDLRCEHIYLTTQGVRILDCLEFDQNLRTADVLSDLAFLVSDLERLGHQEAAASLTSLYREFTADAYPPSLLDFYVAYRLMIRAKVAAIRAAQTGEADIEPGHLIGMAIEHLLAAAPVAICVGGLPGSGKSAIGSWIAQARGDVYLSSDEIRHERNGDSGSDEWEQGAYRPAETEAVYAEMLERAGRALSEGYSVLLDASWRDATHRTDAHLIASENHALAIDLLCQIDERTALARVRGHRAGFSQAGAKARLAMTKEFDEWPGAHLVVTDHDVQQVADHVVPVIDREIRAYSIDCRATS